jgi:uncharacterized protein YggE
VVQAASERRGAEASTVLRVTSTHPNIERTLRVPGVGSAEADADRCILLAVLHATAETTGDALSNLSELVTRSLALLHEEGLAEGDVRTMNVTLRDRRDRSQDDVIARSAAYRMRIVVSGLERAGALLSRLAGVAGDNLEVEGLELSVSDAEALGRSARRLAVLDAQNRAGELAAAAGVTLGDLVSIEEGPFQGERGPRRLVATAAAGSASPPIPPLPVEGGPLSVTSVVTLLYRIA